MSNDRPTVTNSPEKIWLCFGDLSDMIEETVEYAELYRDGDIGWCASQVDDSDVKYVRADLYEQQAAEIERLRAELEAKQK